MDSSFKKYIKAEVNAMLKSKYIESEKAHRDLGSDDICREKFFHKWIKEHSAEFCLAWPKSLCRTCLNNIQCMDQLREECDHYIPDPNA